MSNRKIMLITGASRGIGAATAKLAAERGYGVCINYRQNAQAAQTLTEDLQRTGAQVAAFQADVSIETEVVRMFEAIDAQFGPVSVLINNAGMLEPQTRVADMSAERLARVFFCVGQAKLLDLLLPRPRKASG